MPSKFSSLFACFVLFPNFTIFLIVALKNLIIDIDILSFVTNYGKGGLRGNLDTLKMRKLRL